MTTCIALVAVAAGCTAAEPTSTSGTSTPGGALGAQLPVGDLEAVGASADRARSSDTGRILVSVRVVGTDAIDGELLRIEGSFAIGDDLASLTLTPGPMGEQGGLTASSAVAHGSDVYVEDPAVVEALGVDTDWVLYVDECGVEGLGQGLVPFGGADALSLLDTVAASGAEITEVGEEKVAGFDAVHFAGTVDLGAAVALAAPDCESEWAAFEGSSVPIDVWVHTTSGVVMRELLTFELEDFLGRTDPDSAAIGSGLGGSVEYRVDFFDLGEPVDIEVPTDDEVTEVTREEYEAVDTAADARTD